MCCLILELNTDINRNRNIVFKAEEGKRINRKVVLVIRHWLSEAREVVSTHSWLKRAELHIQGFGFGAFLLSIPSFQSWISHSFG